MRNVLVQVTAMSHYTSKSADQNGHKGDFCQFGVDSGKTVDVRFNIWDLKRRFLTVERVRVAFYDMDEGLGESSREVIAVDDTPLNEEDQGHAG